LSCVIALCPFSVVLVRLIIALCKERKSRKTPKFPSFDFVKVKLKDHLLEKIVLPFVILLLFK